MGYDDGECVFCYLRGNGNNCTDNRNIICGQCIEECGSKLSSGRVIASLRDNMEYGISKCDKCVQKKIVCFNISVCKNCNSIECNNNDGSGSEDENTIKFENPIESIKSGNQNVN